MSMKSIVKGPKATRREVLVGAAAAVVVAGFPAIVRAQSKTIVTTLFGGVYEERYRKHVLAPFEEKTGVQFVIKYGSPSEWFTNAMVNAADPEIDLPFLTVPVAMKAIKTDDIFIDLKPSDMPNLKDVDPLFYDAYDRKAVGFNYISNGIIYRTPEVVPPPRSWGDLWDERFRDRVLMPDVSGGFFHEKIVIAAILNGGSETDLEPGYEALKRLKPNVFRWFKSPNEVPQILERGEAWLGSAGSSRAYAMRDSGLPVDFVNPREGAPVGVLSYHVPKNARNRDLLLEFVNFAIGVEPQTGFGNEMQSGMVNKRVTLVPDVARRVTPHEKLMRLDWRKIEPQMNEMVERFHRDVIG
jgi:putative spermidine/putrescine transport system substrate-binding protein